MRSTIDPAGRVVIPRSIRDELGWGGGEEIEIEVADGLVTISPVTTKMTLVQTDDGVVAVPETDLPPLTVDVVRKTQDSTRR
jgi:AbrB family looped-hinge helix DNA binding protein